MTIRFKIFENAFLLSIAAVTLLFLYLATGYGRIARLLPMLVCTITLALLAIRIAQVNFSKEDTGTVTFRNRVFFLAGLAMALLALVPITGLMLSSALFLPSCILSFGYRKAVPIMAITAGYLVSVYLLFIKMFNMPLPDSLLGL